MRGRGDTIGSGKWISVTISVALMVMICQLLVMSGHSTPIDERSYLLWVW